jgi:hypothetical protein
MATSGSTDLSTDRNTIIRGALRIVGGIAQGETPTTDQYTEAAEALNFLVKALEADGMPLWAMKEYSVPLTVSTASYRIGLSQTVNTPKPLRVISAYRRDSTSNIDVPMVKLTRDEYNLLGNKTSEGTPSQFYYDPQRTYGDLFLFPVPDSSSATNSVVRIVYQRPFEDFDASTDEPDFPQEWFDALKFLLADRLAPEYGVGIQERQDIRSRAKQLKEEALSFGSEEGSIYFAYDHRSY